MELLPIVAIVLLFWLLLIRPESRRRKKLAQLQAELQPGARVLLGAGIFGTISAIDPETDNLRLEVAEGVHLEVARGAVVGIHEPAALEGDDHEAWEDPESDADGGSAPRAAD